VELGRDPAVSWQEAANRDCGYNQNVIRAVNESLNILKEDEAGFIRCYYFQGMGYREISELTGRDIYRLESVHKRALRKLRNVLPVLIDSDDRDNTAGSKTDCPLCCHKEKDRINRLIENKKPDETWKQVMKILQEKFGIRVSTPQILIGHQKYHMNRKEL
jgi:hypothetical protein